MTLDPRADSSSRTRDASGLRRVAPELLIAACVALAIMAAIHYLETREQARMVAQIRADAVDGLTMDERLGAYDTSIGKSVGVFLPSLAAVGGVLVGLASRRRRWAWLTAIAAAMPAVAMGVAYFVDRPASATAAATAYAVCAAVPAVAIARLRRPPPDPSATE